MDNTLKLVSVRRDRGRAILTLSNGETLTMPRSMLKERYGKGCRFACPAPPHTAGDC